jgi:hypothetical protein
MTDAGPTFPPNGIIQLTFDRNLLPVTVTRQSITITDESGNFATPVVAYDPVARIISLENPTPAEAGPCWLTANQYYNLNLLVPTGFSSDTGGIRAIDRATLPAPITIGFQASVNPCPTPQPLLVPQTDFCSDVLPIFQARCTLPQCHQSPAYVPATGSTLFPENPDGGLTAPAQGLALDNVNAVRQTALNVPSHEANTGPQFGTAAVAEPQHIFGIDMPIIDTSGDPANSYLLYKVLLANPSPADDPGLLQVCAGVQTIPDFNPGPEAQAMSDPERSILSNFILGREMPYPVYPNLGDPVPADAANGGYAPLSFHELERLRAWIANGAVVPAACPENCSAVDAGAGGGMDAGVDASMDAGDAAKDSTTGG